MLLFKTTRNYLLENIFKYWEFDFNRDVPMMQFHKIFTQVQIDNIRLSVYNVVLQNFTTSKKLLNMLLRGM